MTATQGTGDDVASEPPAYGTWRVQDGTQVAFRDAERAWADHGRDVLTDVARRYHAVITYGDFAEEVQARSGIRTRSLMMNWIGGVLGAIAEDCASRSEPLLTALCVHQDGTVGEGYAGAVAATQGERPEDPDQHAAEERLACHRHFGADLPPDGGRPALTRKVAAARAQRAVRARASAPAAVCPHCFVQLPATGRCDNCG